MGLKNLINSVKITKAKADSQKKEISTKKEVEKQKKKFENKKDKEIAKIKETEAYQTSFSTGEYKAYIVVNLVNGTLSEELAVLGAEVGYKNEQPVLRVKDKEDNIIFEEPKPDAIDEFNYTNEETVKTQVKKCEKAIEKLQSGNANQVDNLYESDWLESLRYWKAREVHIQLGEKGSYMKLRNGMPHYEFDLVGYFKIPVYRYTSKSTISIPPLGKIITGQVLMKKIDEEIDADVRDAQALMNTIYGILIGIALLASFFLLYSSGQTDASLGQSLADATKSLESLIDRSAQLDRIEAGVNNVTSTINQNVTNPETIKNINKIIS